MCRCSHLISAARRRKRYPSTALVYLGCVAVCRRCGIPRNRQRIVRRTVTGKTAHIVGRYRSCYFQRKRRTYTVYFCRQCDSTRRPRPSVLHIAYFKPTVQLGAKLAYRIIRRTSVCINDLRPDFRFIVNKSEICTAVAFLRIISVISRCKRIRTSGHIQRYALYRIFDNVERKLCRNSAYSAITHVSTHREYLIPLRKLRLIPRYLL